MAVEERGKMTDLLMKCTSREEIGEGGTACQTWWCVGVGVCVCACVHGLIAEDESLVSFQILSDGKHLCLHLVSSSFFSFKMLQDTHLKHL